MLAIEHFGFNVGVFDVLMHFTAHYYRQNVELMHRIEIEHVRVFSMQANCKRMLYKSYATLISKTNTA